MYDSDPALSEELDGEWTIAYEDLFTKKYNDEYPMYTNGKGFFNYKRKFPNELSPLHAFIAK